MSYTLDYFIDENIKLYQNPNDFRFNTDTKLLARFVRLKKQERILDVGTNNGVLLVYFDRFNVKELVGVEVMKESVDVALMNQKNFIQHPSKIIHSPIQDFEDDLFDVIVSNPPYFKLSANQPIEHMDARQLSRMEENLTLEELIQNVARLIKSYGRFYMVHRPNRLNEIMKCLFEHNFNIRHIQFAYDSKNNVVKSVLVEAIKDSNCDMVVDPPIYI